MFQILKDIDLINDVGKYDVILVGTNTMQTMGNGFQKKIRKLFSQSYKLLLSTKYADKTNIGKRITTNNNTTPRISLCFITYGYNFRPDIQSDYLDYEGLENCLKTANNEFKGLNVATTLLGTSKFDGNGDKERVLKLLETNSTKINLFVYDYEQVDRDKEYVEKYKEIVNDKNLTPEEKYKKLMNNKNEDKKLFSLDNSVKRNKRIKNEINEILKK